MLIECTPETYGRLRKLADYCDEHGHRPDDTLSALAVEYMVRPNSVQPLDKSEHEQASKTRRKT